jgi:hypothetical protein
MTVGPLSSAQLLLDILRLSLYDENHGSLFQPVLLPIQMPGAKRKQPLRPLGLNGSGVIYEQTKQ